nr:hypothetical protein [Tanacetum cinerariifolium]
VRANEDKVFRQVGLGGIVTWGVGGVEWYYSSGVMVYCMVSGGRKEKSGKRGVRANEDKVFRQVGLGGIATWGVGGVEWYYSSGVMVYCMVSGGRKEKSRKRGYGVVRQWVSSLGTGQF